MTMDLSMKVNLYYGNSPVEGATSDMQQIVARENQFCAVFVKNDLPSAMHEGTIERLLDDYGVNTSFGMKNGYVRPYIVNRDGKATNGRIFGQEFQSVPAKNRKGTGITTGGVFFDRKIADVVVSALQREGYEIIRKYD